MSLTPEQAAAEESQMASLRYARAQDSAMHWAEQAEAEYVEASRHADYVRDKADNDYLRDTVAHKRREAQFHGSRCTEAVKLAEMWARVASALIPPPEPLELITSELGTTDG